MGRYRITDPATGRTLTVEGDAPPTQNEAAEIFKGAPAAQSAAPSTKVPTIFPGAMGMGAIPPETMAQPGMQSDYTKAGLEGMALGGAAAAAPIVGPAAASAAEAHPVITYGLLKAAEHVTPAGLPKALLTALQYAVGAKAIGGVLGAAIKRGAIGAAEVAGSEAVPAASAVAEKVAPVVQRAVSAPAVAGTEQAARIGNQARMLMDNAKQMAASGTAPDAIAQSFINLGVPADTAKALVAAALR